MAETEEQLANEVVSGEGGASGNRNMKLVVMGLLTLGLVGLFSAGGFLAGSTLKRARASSDQDQQSDNQVISSSQEHVYIDLDPVTATLNTPNRERTAMAVFMMLVEPADAEAANLALNQKRPEVNSRILRYLSARSLEELSGELNMNRVARELQDLINETLWPGQRGLVQRIEYKNFNIQ